MIKKIQKALQNRDFILFLALIIGLLFPQATPWTRHLTLPALAVVMTLSTMGISGNLFRSPRSLITPAFFGIVMSYGVLAVFILGTSAFVVHDTALREGFVILALMPPAVAVIPFTDLLKGDGAFSLAGMVGGYLGALIILPFALYTFLGSSHFVLERLTVIAVVLIVLPLLISRIFLRRKIAQNLPSLKGPITNWSFFVVVYTIVGLNQDIFIQQPLRLLPVAAIAVGSMFILGPIIEWLSTLLRVNPQTTTSLVLLGTIKNYGLAAGIALALFSKESALPATVSTIFMFIYIIWMDVRKRRSR